MQLTTDAHDLAAGRRSTPLRAVWLVVAAAAVMSLVASSAGAAEPPVKAQESPGYSWRALTTEVERTHPLMAAARSGIDEFEAKLSQAKWAWFPSFKIEGSATLTPRITGDPIDSDTDYGHFGYFFTFSAKMVQPVWTFGKIGALKRAARAGVHVARMQVETARWELRFRAAQAYMGKLLAIELNRILADGKKWLDKAQRRMERLRDEDSEDYDQLEHLRLKTRVADFYLLETENKLLDVQSSQGLRVLLSKQPSEAVELATDELHPVEYRFLPSAEYVEVALANEPSLQVARRTHRAHVALADSKHAELWPDLVVIGEANAKTANEVDAQHSVFANDSFNGAGIGALLGLRWNLDVAQRVLKEDEARAKAARMGYQAEVRQDLVELKVHELHQRLDNKRELVCVFRASKKAAQGWLTATWDTYDAGFGNFRDVMDALVQFYSKKFGYLQAVFEHNVLVYQLSQAVGVDITEMKGSSPTVRPGIECR